MYGEIRKQASAFKIKFHISTTMRRIFDFLILSFIISLQLSFGYIFTATIMIIFYATVYAFIIDVKNPGS
jgi:hypothetical protein